MGLASPPPCPGDLPAVVVEARVALDGSVRGHLRGPDDLELADPLARLPMPADDLQVLRTFPGRPELGWLSLTPEGAGVWAFEAHLPARYGAAGALPGRGVWADGGWLPQPVEEGRLRRVCWSARVALPEGALGVLNGAVGKGSVAWWGAADRLALAVLARGRARRLEAPGRLVVVDDGPPRPQRDRLLAATLAGAWPPGLPPPDLVVVVGPQVRRLVRPGPGVLFLSDRAFRLTGPLRRYHRLPVAVGLLAAALPVPDAEGREFAALALARRWAEAERVRDPGNLLARAAWLPQVDALLATGGLPFQSEVLDEAWPDDPVRDALEERFGRRVPPRVLAAWIGDLAGEEALAAMADAILRGLPLERAAAEAGVPPGRLAEWRVADGVGNVAVEVADDPPRVVVRRTAPWGAPAVPVVLETDGERRVLPGRQGSWEETVPLPAPPRRVRVDPDAHLRQVERSDDAWPPRWSVVLAAVPHAVNLTERTVAGVAWATLRRPGDTRHRTDLLVATDEVDLVSGTVRRVRHLGRLLDRRTRSQALAAWIAPALLAPSYRPTEGSGFALGAGVGWFLDDRVTSIFPLDGRSVRLAAEGGLVPGTTAWWGSVRARASRVGSPHPRWALAGFASAGIARSDIPHRLVGLGGLGALQSLPPGLVVGRAASVAAGEVRWAPLRRLSLPLGLAWFEELQLAAGLEVGGVMGASVDERAVLDPADRYLVAGWTLGVAGVADVLGAAPAMLGVTLARPFLQQPLLQSEPALQVVLRAGHSF